MNKGAIQRFAIWARTELITQVSQRAYQYGITKDGYGEQNAVTVGGRALTTDEQRQRKELVEQIRSKGYTQVMEEVAYTWFNRFIALRFMEVNNYLPSHIRVFSDSTGAFKPEILNDVLHLDLPGLNTEKVAEYIEKNQTEDLYRYLLLTQCNALNASLPQMFERMGGFTELLLPNNILKQDSILGHMVTDIPEEDWTDQVQILGWLYQYYNSELKDDTFALLKKSVKITKERVPSATQLFTPDWIVRYMVENSLGRLWIEGHPDEELKAGWKYYLDEAEQEDDVQKQLDAIRVEYRNIKPQDIKVIDPCMGSGHILVYAFDVLIQIYKKYGISERDAAQSILENNLYGLDIDDRAAQLAYFAVMMKARQYDRRIFSRGIQPHVYSIAESNGLDRSTIDYFTNNDPKLKKDFGTLVDELRDAKEYGSILNISQVDFAALFARIDEVRDDISIFREVVLSSYLPLIQVAEVMARKYDVVVTNPPYMGNKGFSTKLLDYITKWYYECKIDLFAVFIQKCSSMVNKNGIYSLITPDSWMFLSRFEKLRIPFLTANSFCTIAHMGFGAFDSGFGTAAFTAIRKDIPMYKSTCLRLVDIPTSSEKEEAFFTLPRIISNKMNYSKVIGNPICYWASQRLIDSFSHKTIKDLGSSCVGLVTGNNERFIRDWYEIDYSLFGRNMSREEAISSESLKWFPINQSGDYRKWYGNNINVFDWWHDGFNIKKFKLDRYLRGEAEKKNSKCWNEESYFHEGLTWSRISTDRFSARYSQLGCTAGTTCPIYFPNANKEYILGLLNTKVIGSIVAFLNPTVSFQAADIDRIPVIVDQGYLHRIREIVEQNIAESKKDWDSFEISWDFISHPIAPSAFELREQLQSQFSSSRMEKFGLISWHYENWKQNSEDRFNLLKSNEEELNRIFIDIYGLQDELTPEVEEKDVTVRKADLGRDIRSLISYAVGCMFGRYSLDEPGLAYAGGEWDASKYSTIIPDKDNIIPICDDDYFDDDITGRFVKWVETVYGSETLEENLKFIADALGGKGTPREIIRSYFINDFYADHMKIYQKSPIYWLFDSGKKNGFKALVYMHRYQSDLLARMRTDYVHEQQERYRTQLSHLADAIDHASASERVKLTKQQKKIQEQALEIQKYEEKVHHLADQNIQIDLDDGVKHNYELFADVLAKIK